MLYCLAAIFTVTLGGITGVLQAFPVLDYAFNGTYWIVGHFHYVMAGTTLFALLAGLYYWWPKITKRKYNETFGIINFRCGLHRLQHSVFPILLSLRHAKKNIHLHRCLRLCISKLNRHHRRLHIWTSCGGSSFEFDFKLKKTCDAQRLIRGNAQELEWTQNYPVQQQLRQLYPTDRRH